MKFGKRRSIVNISHDLLHNRFVLYFVFCLSVVSLFYSVLLDDLLSVGVFIVSSLLTSFFSKNMVVILVVALVVSNVVRLTYKTRDGFTTEGEEEEEDEGFKDEEGDDEEEEGFKNDGEEEDEEEME